MNESSRAGRPLSPHLQIWGWTVTMASSITHRATGIALYGGAALLTVWFFAASAGEDAFRPINAFLGSPFGAAILFGFAWSLIYHTLNGLRHLYWDTGRGLHPEMARMTAWLVYASSLLAALILFLWAGAFQ